MTHYRLSNEGKKKKKSFLLKELYLGTSDQKTLMLR